MPLAGHRHRQVGGSVRAGLRTGEAAGAKTSGVDRIHGVPGVGPGLAVTGGIAMRPGRRRVCVHDGREEERQDAEDSTPDIEPGEQPVLMAGPTR